MSIPPAPLRKRQITRHISTNMFNVGGGWVRARYVCTEVYKTPLDAPDYARMRPAGLGGVKGKWGGMWEGEVVLEMFAKTEIDALSMLLDRLDNPQTGHNYDREQAIEALDALNKATKKTPWEQRPFGLRGYKPQRARHHWKDETGVLRYYYKDTLQHHADPNCPCPRCPVGIAAALNTPNTTEKK